MKKPLSCIPAKMVAVFFLYNSLTEESERTCLGCSFVGLIPNDDCFCDAANENGNGDDDAHDCETLFFNYIVYLICEYILYVPFRTMLLFMAVTLVRRVTFVAFAAFLATTFW